MTFKSLSYALAAGLATFLAVGIVVTELARPTIEFSVLVGIPAGLLAGALAAALVYLGSTDDAPARRRHTAVAFGTFGGVFLLTLVVEAVVLNATMVLSLVVATLTGVIAAVVAYVRGRTRSPDADDVLASGTSRDRPSTGKR